MEEREGQNGAMYEPTLNEQKLLEVLLDPANRLKRVTEICDIAGVDRKTYYRAFEKPGFVTRYEAESKALAVRVAGPLMNATIKDALSGSHQDRKLLLEMIGMYSPKQRTELTGANGGPVAWEGIRPRDEVEQRLREMGLLPHDEEKGEG